MDHETFDKYRTLVYEHSGITLAEGKQALVTARVSKRMRELGISCHRQYLDYLQTDNTGEELVSFLDVISTNVTSFYREAAHFDFLTDAIRKWVDQGQRRFRLWSAASSSGEEPYTLAITALEATAGSNVDLKILATDISTRMLRKCWDGVYSEERVKTVPADLRQKYFTVERNGSEKLYTVKDSLRNVLVFKRLNLSQPPFPMKGPLDAIFCRNVMIYFDNQVRSRLLQDQYRLLKKQGYLMVGHSESLTGLVSSFRSVRPSIYTKE